MTVSVTVLVSTTATATSDIDEMEAFRATTFAFSVPQQKLVLFLTLTRAFWVTFPGLQITLASSRETMSEALRCLQKLREEERDMLINQRFLNRLEM